MALNLAIVGSRSITDKKELLIALEQCPWIPRSVQTISPNEIDLTVVTGGGDGINTLAQEWAEFTGFDRDIIGQNTRIVERADKVLAVWDGESTGTRESIDTALDMGKPTYVEVVE